MKCSIVQDRCPFHLAQHAKHSCQGSLRLSDGPLSFCANLCCLGHWALPLFATPTGPWSHSPQPQLLPPLTPCQKTEPSRHLFTLKVFGNAPDCCCLRCNWACKNIKARIAWHVMKWEKQRAERKRRLTKHPTSNRKMRGRKGEKIKQQWEKKTKASFHETCRDRRSGSVLALGLRSLL